MEKEQLIKPQLVDMIRSAPEVAVRLWAGGMVNAIGDKIRITFEGRTLEVHPLVFEAALKILKVLSIRWMGRMLRTIQDVLDLRHSAEDIFFEDLFGKSDLPKVLFVPAGLSASAYYRAMIPADLMYEGGSVISHWTSSVDLAKVIRYDMLWMQLMTSHVLTDIVKKAQEQGVKIVYDIDDRLDAIPMDNQAIEVYGDPAKQKEILDVIRMADCVTVSTEPLAEYIRGCGAKKVIVVRNMVTANVAPRRHPPNPAFTKIFWAGSPTHKHDLAIIAPALKSVLKRHAGKVRFTCLGERMPEVLADCYDFIDLVEPVDFDRYHDTIANFAADFGIAPLTKNLFNESKSAIKALEYASAGYPMLLSPVGEYSTIVSEGFPVELVLDHEWEIALERMIARSPAERDKMGKAALAWVLDNRCVGRTKAAQWCKVALEIVGKKKEEPVLKT